MFVFYATSHLLVMVTDVYSCAVKLVRDGEKQDKLSMTQNDRKDSEEPT